MTARKKKWIIGAAAAVVVAAVAVVFVTASILNRRFEPYIRAQAIAYLSKRFDGEAQVGRLRVAVPRIPPLRLLLKRGSGVIAHVSGDDIEVRHKGRRDIPPMFKLKRFRFDVDLGQVLGPSKRVNVVYLEGMEIHVPPKGERPRVSGQKTAQEDASGGGPQGGVVIERVVISDSRLVILPRAKDRVPLEFDLHSVVLDSVQKEQALRYRAELTNPKPAGLIRAQGGFGPWDSESPSDTPLHGDYTFSDADLGVFSSIAGIMQSTGHFAGTLGALQASGEAHVPDFRLRSAGNPVPLYTRYEALVDGTNGDTTLKPVKARLNTTAFTTSGAVMKHDGDKRRSIDLNVQMPDGEVKDLLRLALKTQPPLAGRIAMTATIRIPPEAGKVKEKLIVKGRFRIRKGQFLSDAVQDKIDGLSRRAQGQPKNEAIGDVFSEMSGVFHLEDQTLRMEGLQFGVPGARVDLTGQYGIAADGLDFAGTLRLDARVSQTMTGWKRWALKPIDPIFAKDGAGTVLKIKVTGSAKAPQFGATR